MTNLHHNLILDVDSYKASHFEVYPPGLTYMFDYIEARDGGEYDETVFFGLQYILKKYFSQPITRQDVEEAEKFCAAHGEPFPKAAWMRVVDFHGGMLPLRICAVPEGAVVPTGNVLVTVESTDPQLPWIGSWMETQLMRVWYPTTVATRSYACKKIIRDALTESSDDPKAELPFKLHDFGGRGVSSAESAGVGGMAHLVNFMGSDTIEGIRYANHYYNHEMAAFSIRATEHSTMSILGRDDELTQMRRAVANIPRGGLAACVSDTYDFEHAVEHYWGDQLHDAVKNSGGTMVIRPDSGNPAQVNLRALQILDHKIGTRVNSKSFRVLPDYYRLIQGDGIRNEHSIDHIYDVLLHHGYSASNIAFGMGGGLLQDLNRDTCRFAMKCSAATVDGRTIDVFKAPKGDSNKNSKAGVLDLVKHNEQYKTVRAVAGQVSELVKVWENGRLLKDYTLAEVRANAEKNLW